MKNQLISAVEQDYIKKETTPFKPGDTVKVEVMVIEGDKKRIQPFQGVCISRKNAGISETFTVRKISFGIGIERTFMLHSPNLSGISIVKRGKVRRAKLYYLRNKSGKEARIKERK